MFITITYKHSEKHTGVTFIGLEMYGVDIAVKGFKEYIEKNYTFGRINWDQVYIKLPLKDKIPYLEWQKQNQNIITN